jgi:uncharacterized membrane protein YgcG
LSKTLPLILHTTRACAPIRSTRPRDVFAVKASGKNHASQADLDNHANQLNPNSDAYKAAQDNRSNQLNPNHSKSKSGGGGGRKSGGGGGKKK